MDDSSGNGDRHVIDSIMVAVAGSTIVGWAVTTSGVNDNDSGKQ